MNVAQTLLTALTTVELSQWAAFTISGLIAMALGAWGVHRERLAWRPALVLMGAALIAGLFIGHWVALAFKPHQVLADPARLLILTRGGVCSLGVYGGAALGMALMAHLKRLPFWPYADAFAPGLLIAAAAARLSCIVHGCDFGHVATGALPWAVRYPRGTAAFAYLKHRGLVDAYRDVGAPMHPFPLYEALPVFVIGLTAALAPQAFGARPGQRAAGCAALYCGVRVLAESYRAVDQPLGGGLDALQALCAVGCAVFAGLWLSLRRPRATSHQETPHAIA